MPGQTSAGAAASASLDDQIASLNALLSTLARTRSALPTLVRTASSTSSPSDRAQHYRAASTECQAAVRSLGEQLDALESVFQAVEDSERRDSKGIVVRAPAPNRPASTPATDALSWSALGKALQGPGAGRSGKGETVEVYSPLFPPPRSHAEVVDLTRGWQAKHPRTRVDVAAGPSEQLHELRFVARGVLHAHVALRWARGPDGDERACEADYVTCHALSEDKLPFETSDFAIFRTLSNQAMAIIDGCRVRRAAGETVASIEEVLAFLTTPPLPY